MANGWGGYTPKIGDYTMANASGSNNSTGQIFNNENNNFMGTGMGGLQTAQMGMGIISDIGGLWSAYEQNALAKDTFDFNKDMLTKNYNMMKDQYDSKVRRSNRIADFTNYEGSWEDAREQGGIGAVLDSKAKDKEDSK